MKDRKLVINRENIFLCTVILLFIAILTKIIIIFHQSTFNTLHQKFYGLSAKTKNENTQFQRLNIIDRNNNILANNIPVYDFYLIPSKMINFANNIAKIKKIIKIEKDSNTIINHLKEKNDILNGMVLIKKGISIQEKELLLKSGVLGVFFAESEKRFYPYGNLSYHITGLASFEKNGLSGIEKEFDSYLKNVVNKHPLQLSIDINIQSLVRSILLKKLQATGANGATALIMNVKTGEIIVAISLPDCNPNFINECTNDEIFNRFSLGVYELGSIFKLFLATLAFDHGLSPYKTYKREAYRIGNYTIHDIDRKESQGGDLTILDTIKYSSNVGCAKIIEEIGLVKQQELFRKLHLFEKLNFELPELSRTIYPKRPSLTDAVAMSYGHGIAITPLHYITAISALLANHDIMPTLLKYDHEPLSNKKVVSDHASELLKFTMREVIDSGAGKIARLNEYAIGGKSGTAIKQVNGKYDIYKMTLSFVAAVPIEDPEYTFLLVLDEPKVDKSNNFYYRGAPILGPVMKEIISIVGPMLKLKSKDSY